jgi:hypothetical protein
VIGPFGQGAFDGGVGDRDDLVGPWGEANQPGAAVGGVGDSLEVSLRFELLDEEAGGLFGHAGLVGQVGDARALGTDAGRDPLLGEREVGEAGGGDGVMGSLLECSVGDEQQDAEVRFLTARRHAARLDR